MIKAKLTFARTLHSTNGTQVPGPLKIMRSANAFPESRGLMTRKYMDQANVISVEKGVVQYD